MSTNKSTNSESESKYREPTSRQSDNSVLPDHLQPLDLSPYKKHRGWFLAAIAFQIALIGGTAVQPAFTIAQGRTVTFTTAPVDPWDMFRGDYITLGYKFSSVTPPPEHLDRDQVIYVVLQKEGSGKWQAVRSSTTLPKISKGELVLKGRVEYYDKKSTSVRYGIERVYVAEGAGKNVNSGDQLQVDVAINADGSGVIKELRDKEKTFYKFHML